MQIQATNQQYIIQIQQSEIKLTELQQLVDYLRFKSIASRSQASETDVERLAEEVTKSGWNTLQKDLLNRINR